MLAECDMNDDGTLVAHEIFECMVKIENEWRDEHCPDYGHAYCENPFVIEECPGAWTCSDIE